MKEIIGEQRRRFIKALLIYTIFFNGMHPYGSPVCCDLHAVLKDKKGGF
jgi:hypothetical protein